MNRGFILSLVLSGIIAVALILGVPAMAAAGILTFTWPWAMGALVILPPLYRLLRVLPPAPRRIVFPPLQLLFGLIAGEETPRKTPLWLVALRLAALIFAIIGFAQPILEPQGNLSGQGSLLVVIDDGWAAAADWQGRQNLAVEFVDKARQENREVFFATTAPNAQDNGVPKVEGPLSAGVARERILALQPKPWPVDRKALSAQLIADSHVPQTTAVIYLTDGMDGVGTETLALQLQRLGSLTVYTSSASELPPILLPPESDGSALRIKLHRPAPGIAGAVPVTAYAENGRSLAELEAVFPEGATETTARLDLPLELRNELGRIEVTTKRTAAGVFLLDEGAKRRPVGLITEGSPDSAQPFLDPLYYIARAMQPYVELRRGGIDTLLQRDLAVLVFADTAPAQGAERQKVDQWIEEGGIALRFAGPRLAETEDDFVPVRLRRGERALSGALLWGEPAHLAPFEERSPFAGLTIPEDIAIKRQVLAEPSLDLAERSWAQLIDGTPLVTAEKRGKGWLILVHTGGSPEWSNLPLSGLFVDMLRRIVALSQGINSSTVMKSSLPALQLVDGFGRLGPANTTVQPLSSTAAEPAVASFRQPPGYYGLTDFRRALNLGPAVVEAAPLSDLPTGIKRLSYTPAVAQDLTGYLLALALFLLLIEGIASLLLRGVLRFGGDGRLGNGAIGSGKATLGGLFIFVIVSLSAGHAKAQTTSVDDFAMKASLDLRLAYVVTGIREVDEISRMGLTGLGYVLNQRTAAEPAQPLGVDPARDDLAFFALLYWPIDARQPDLTPEAVRRLTHFMASGGTLILDVRDGSVQGAAAARLRDIGRSLQLPTLQPLPRDHVLTKSFYLLSEFPGRWSGGTLWVEATEDRINDGVSGVIVGYGDYAAAWAADAAGYPLYPVAPGGEVQREIAYRVGVNMVMYALTGSYKADQVHIPAIMERLGE